MGRPSDGIRGLCPFQVYSWPPLHQCFSFGSSGLESKRDHIVYDVSEAKLKERLSQFLALADADARAVFNETTMNTAAKARSLGIEAGFARKAGYRPLDLRWNYAHPRWNDRLRTELNRAWGASNVCLFAMPFGTNAGPGVWCHDSYPDRHALSGRGGLKT